jgi:hypothetical protein
MGLDRRVADVVCAVASNERDAKELLPSTMDR